MNKKTCVAVFFSVLLIPAGFCIAALAMRGLLMQATGLYALALAMHALTHSKPLPWGASDPTVPVQVASRRIFFLIVLTTLNALGSCPTWFVGLLCAATLMQWTGYFFVRPSRMGVPSLPEIGLWKAAAQGLVLGIFLVDLTLIQTFPNNFRLSATFHLAGYSFLAALVILQLAHDFFRMRRSLVFWFRALAFHP